MIRLAQPNRSLHLLAPARIGHGILRLTAEEKAVLREDYRESLSQRAIRICKFVPASGAASRMFNFLSGDNPESERFFAEFSCFPFVPLLLARGIEQPERMSRHELLRLLLDELDLLGQPKALLPFHLHNGKLRTPLHEHAAELLGLVDSDLPRDARLHLTIGPEQQVAFRSAMAGVAADLAVPIPYTLSSQSPGSDTVALDESGGLLRDCHGRIVFRPGGHGSLLDNLNQIEADFIFIKNIDNVPHPDYPNSGPDERRAMAGLLWQAVRLRDRILQACAGSIPTAVLHDEIDDFNRRRPGFLPAGTGTLLRNDPAGLRRLVDRPVRVCGMVANQGDPGGGPFWVADRTGKPGLQIVEQAQIDRSDPQQAAVFAAATHFNPVDMVCCIRDSRQRPYPLTEFSDPDSDFVSTKTHQGQTIRVLEHPGLWNGAMAGWLSLFVEMEPTSFCPVKTVNDLLRPAHQPQAKPDRP